jgi:hypothetical protein
VLAALRERGGASIGELAAVTSMPVDRTAGAASALAADGVVSLFLSDVPRDGYASIE